MDVRRTDERKKKSSRTGRKLWKIIRHWGIWRVYKFKHGRNLRPREKCLGVCSEHDGTWRGRGGWGSATGTYFMRGLAFSWNSWKERLIDWMINSGRIWFNTDRKTERIYNLERNISLSVSAAYMTTLQGGRLGWYPWNLFYEWFNI